MTNSPAFAQTLDMRTLVFGLALVALACGDDSSGGGSFGGGGGGGSGGGGGGSSMLCSDSCAFANDGECDDGGPGAQFAECALGTDCSDCGPRSSSGGGGGGGENPVDAGGGGGGSGCRCTGAINGDAYDVACGEELCVDGQERRCSERRLVGLDRSCGGGGGSCTPLRESGCSEGPSCCSVSGGGVATCFNNTCCRATGQADSSAECCRNSIETEGKICCFLSDAPTDC